MASKFFTWTKGDRRNAAESYQSYRVDGLMPVDQYPFDHAEAQSDLTHTKRRKKGHRPKPLQLGSPPARNTIDASTFQPSSVLHETAITSVTSASNLLAVVNDMLRSPAFNNPLGSPSQELRPPSRPRSHTAPSTPSIAELPGSILLENQGFPDESKTKSSDEQALRADKRRTVAAPLIRPATTIPNGAHHKKSLSLNTTSLHWGTGFASSSTGTRSSRGHHRSVDSRSTEHQSMRDRREYQSDNSSMLRSPITELTESSSAFAFAGSESSSVPAKQPSMRAPHGSKPNDMKATIATQAKTIAAMRSQFQHLRISHEAHVASLGEAHRKELDAMRSYIQFLESSRDGRPPNPQLTIQTAAHRGPSPEVNLPHKRADSLAPEGSQGRPQDSSSEGEVSRERHNSDVSSSSAEGEDDVAKLTKKLESAKKHMAAMRDQMELLMAKKESYKDRAADLEVRARNNHEIIIDLRETEYKLEMERRTTRDKLKRYKAEVQALRAQAEPAEIAQLKKELEEARQQVDQIAAQMLAQPESVNIPDTAAELEIRIDILQEQLRERDEQIYELQHMNQALQLDLEELDTQHVKYAADHDEALAQEARKTRLVNDKVKLTEIENTELRSLLENQGKDLVTVQEEYERLRKLLHAEMRNQAKDAIAKGEVPGTPAGSEEYLQLVALETRRRVQALIAKESGLSEYQPFLNPYERIEQLEKEIDHHVEALIRCKRDNRGYRKDIRRANTKFDKLRESMYSADTRSSTPLHQPLPLTPTESPMHKPSVPVAGLGISTIVPSPAVTASTSGPSNPASAVTPSASDSPFPPSRPKTPVRTNKKLPPYPQLPEGPLTAVPPPPPPPHDNESSSRPITPVSPARRMPIYKLTPTITRTPSASSLKPTPPSPRHKPSLHRAKSTPDTTTTAAAAATAPAPTPPPHRAGTQRSLSESIISSYANQTPTTDHGSPADDHFGGPLPRYYRQDAIKEETPSVLAELVDDKADPPAKASPAPQQQQQQQPPPQQSGVDQEEEWITALPSVPFEKSKRESEEKRLGLVRKRSLEALLKRKESQDGFLKRMGSRKSLAVEGMISRFNSRGRMGGGVMVPVMLEGPTPPSSSQAGERR